MADYWLNKSDINLDAAEKLKNPPNSHHAPSISCSYYACYLKLSHSLYVVLGYTEGKFNIEYNNFRGRSGGAGSHEFMIHLIYTEIASKDKKDAGDFKNEILALKRLRTIADYKNEWQQKDSSDLAFNKAQSVIKVLKRRNL